MNKVLGSRVYFSWCELLIIFQRLNIRIVNSWFHNIANCIVSAYIQIVTFVFNTEVFAKYSFVLVIATESFLLLLGFKNNIFKFWSN